MRITHVVACVAAVSGAIIAPAGAFFQNQPVTPPPKAVEEMNKRIQEAQKAAQVGDVAPAQTAAWTPKTPVWTDAEFERIGGLLAGSWKTTEAVASSGEGKASLVMSIAPVFVEGLPNALYCEIAREDSVRLPFRQTILAMHKVKGKARVTTFEFRRPGGVYSTANTLWAAPEVFPAVVRDDLIATLAIDLDSTTGQCHGTTPHPYPTGLQGAVEMTSEITFDGTTLRAADRGFDGEGKQVWGPAAGASTAFAKFDTGVTVKRLQDGLTGITFPTQLKGETAKDGERVTVHYAGYLPDGRTFDSSYERGQPFQYTKGQPLIQGWNLLMEDLQPGMVRRIVVPSQYAYGAQGRRGVVPPNSALTFDIEVLSVEPAPPPPPPVVQPAPQPVPAPAPGQQQPTNPK